MSVAEKRIGIRADIVKRKAPGRRRGPSFFSLVEAGVHIVDVLLAKTILHQPQSLAEALEMDDLSRPQEADGIGDVRVIGETEDVVIGDPGLLLGGQVLREVGNGVAGDLHGSGGPGVAGGKLGEDPGGVIHKISLKARVLDLLLRQVPGQLVDDGPHHFQVSQFLGSYRSNGNVPYPEKR